jgi:hypothetical protein
VTAVCVMMIVLSWWANGPKPMRVWGKLGMTCPDKAAGGREVGNARVALATKRLGQPLATRTPTVKVWGL